jgi:phenylacetate-coenzyme A ligase PaaK-like adenylate-forming protein
MLALVRHLRASRIQTALQSYRATAQEIPPHGIANWQLERLNCNWQQVIRHVPHYRDLVDQARLPTRFASLEEYRALTPITVREDLQGDLLSRTDDSRSPEDYRSTGGSTGQPVRIPCWRSEATVAGTAAWFARSWINIQPADPLFLLWGHSHLFGRGIRGTIRRLRRQLSDVVLGYCRWSAYDISRPAMRRAADRMLKVRPAYVVGYSVALDRFAEANQDRSDDLQQLRLKAVIGTAEAFPRDSSRDALKRLFACPILMEYGAVETGVLAHEVAENDYRTLWQNYLIEAVENPSTPNRSDLLVTSLFPRCLPLVRYRLGDQIPSDEGEFPILSFRRIEGRCNDHVRLPSGRMVHSEAFAHIVRDFALVQGYQIVQRQDDSLELRLQTAAPLEAAQRDQIRQKLGKLDALLLNVKLCEVNDLEHSVAGKTPTVVRCGG